mgnify:CR=1 FL=1
MDVFRVLEPGLYTTVQDRGRYGYQQFGIPISGAMDQFAYRVANLLVGNPEDSAVLEITVLGPRLEVLAEADIAVTGAEMPLMVNDRPAEQWASIRVKPGDVISLKQVRKGCRAYLAVTGGIDVPVVMGSRSTYVGGRIGGYQGRPLSKGDVLARGPGNPLGSPRRLPEDLLPDLATEITLRAIPGPQDDYFDEGLGIFFDSVFVVSTQADRMGYRLQGPVVPHRKGVPQSIISEPSVPGGVQIPPDGQPIILLLEQTVGGYTKIATVISTDIDRVAQAKPGDRIKFERVDLETAYGVVREREGLMQKIREMLAG